MSLVDLKQLTLDFLLDSGTVILDEEPDVGAGMGAALRLAMSKGYLEKEEKKRVPISKAGQELQAQRYTIEDKAAYVYNTKCSTGKLF